MLDSGFLTLLTVLSLAGVLAYRFSIFHKPKLWRLSLQQIFFLIIAPGFLFPVAFNYLQTVSSLPYRGAVILPDRFLVNMTLMALLFTYGGIAIHAVTKMMSDYLRKDQSELAEINRFFHLSFSHNLTFAGSIVVMLGFTMLELNHIPMANSSQWVSGAVKGLAIGIGFVLAMRNYTKFLGDDYFGRWNDLKMVFVMGWMSFMMLLYGLVKLDPRIDEYQFLLPTLISFSLTTGLSLILVVRRLKRGGIKVFISKRRVMKLLELEESA